MFLFQYEIIITEQFLKKSDIYLRTVCKSNAHGLNILNITF